ncbi:MAG: V-type ATP synthase subunit I, partial [Oscillospiraceae bacterium]|nr:V-type ATP synthase subunit I [Oscillospiraceae bacterium]
RKEEKDDVLSSLRPLNFSTASVGDNCKGTAKENIAAAGERIAQMEEEKKSIEAQIAAEAGHRDELKLRIDTYSTVIARAEAASRLMCTDSAFYCEGWVPADDEKRLAETLARYDCAWETEEAEQEDPEVPIKLKNNAVTRPFTMVTEMYNLPSYNGVDPNPWLMPTFCLFFGIMFADLGYGLILLIGGLLLKFKFKAKGGLGYMGGMAIPVGISCMIFGLITGTFFGDIIPQVQGFFTGVDPDSVKIFSLIDPLKDPMTVLIICLGIGVVHLLLGVAISGYMQIRDGHPIDALWDSGSIFLLFIGIALMALKVTPIVLIVAVVVLIYAQGREAKSIGGKIGSGLYGLYSVVTGWFGDILSYSRLMALMLAGTVVAKVFNSLGAMTGNIVAFIVIFLLGHALNIGLNLIGTFVHTSRLEYLEFFGKWYREGGRKFQPLAVNTKYYNVAKN